MRSSQDALFDQLHVDREFMLGNFRSGKWKGVVEGLREKGIRRLMPASEVGFRNVAVADLAEVVGLDVLVVPGSERELTWERYLGYAKKPDPIEYQELVARSKHHRVSTMSQAEMERLGVVSGDNIESDTVEIAFDTVILTWDGHKYIPREKPVDERSAIETISALIDGETFLVSTVAHVQNLMNTSEVGNSATILPVRVKKLNRFQRADLKRKWIELYRKINRGADKPWKLTPAGPSLMHPEIQQYIEIGVTNRLRDNVLPADFSTIVQEKRLGRDEVWRHSKHVDIGDLAYKQFAQEVVEKGGYLSMSEMSKEMRQQVGMVFSGYSEPGMKVAIQRYLKKVGTIGFSPLARLRDQKLNDLLI